MQEINKYILTKAVAASICHDWTLKILNAKSRNDLLRLYVKGVDFCIGNDFPSNSDLVNFGGDLLPAYGIHVNNPSLTESKDFLVLLGATTGTLDFSKYDVSQIYIKHQSSLKLKVSGNAFIMIDAFDNARLDVTAADRCKVIINLYGDAKILTASIDNPLIKIIHKNKKTY